MATAHVICKNRRFHSHSILLTPRLGCCPQSPLRKCSLMEEDRGRALSRSGVATSASNRLNDSVDRWKYPLGNWSHCALKPLNTSARLQSTSSPGDVNSESFERRNC